jgi:hypothetical protein
MEVILSQQQVPVTRAHLESLTTSDLIRMADNLGIDIPPDLDRIFIIEELLEITSFNEDASAPPDTSDIAGASDTFLSSESAGVSPDADMANSRLIESVPLPRQYNITFIEVMIRDPLWAFVFWEIKAQDREQFEKAQDFEGYYLKVSPRITSAITSTITSSDKPLPRPEDPARQGPDAKGAFTVPVKPDDSAWYLGLSPVLAGENFRKDQSQYKVELCVGLKGAETVLAVSNPFRLPLLHGLSAEGEPRSCRENPLIRLSGYGDLRILRNNERLFRVKKSGPVGTYE